MNKMSGPDDTYYIQKILEGKTDFFSRLVDRYSQQVFLLIVKIVHRQEEAEELAQDVFLKTYRRLHTFKGECRFSTWLYRIAYNTAVSATRKKKTEYLYMEEQLIDNVPDRLADETLNEAESRERLELLAQAIERLEPEERGIITLFYLEEHSVEEVAGITSLTASNVKVRLHRIRKKLHLIMEGIR